MRHVQLTGRLDQIYSIDLAEAPLRFKRREPLRLRQAQLVDATEPGIAARLVR